MQYLNTYIEPTTLRRSPRLRDLAAGIKPKVQKPLFESVPKRIKITKAHRHSSHVEENTVEDPRVSSISLTNADVVPQSESISMTAIKGNSDDPFNYFALIKKNYFGPEKYEYSSINMTTGDASKKELPSLRLKLCFSPFVRSKVEERRKKHMSFFKTTATERINRRWRNLNILKGVRLNRRFDLQMQFRYNFDQKEKSG